MIESLCYRGALAHGHGALLAEVPWNRKSRQAVERQAMAEMSRVLTVWRKFPIALGARAILGPRFRRYLPRERERVREREMRSLTQHLKTIHTPEQK